jgi:chromosome segregation ATPase
MKTIDEMKEQVYENENKNTELELQMEEQKNNYEDKILNLSKDAHKLKELDSDLQKKYDSLKKTYDQEFQSQKNNQENEKLLNSQKLKDIETQLKETQDTFEMAKQAWAKEEAVLK